MNKIRIFSGEFEGEMLYKGTKVQFWALRNERGLQASFEQSPVAVQYPDLELLQALEDIVYGNG
jgi:hypothetical protein